MPEHSIVAEGLVKRYGDKAALDGFDLAVPVGSVYGPSPTAGPSPCASSPT
jgi:ABC-2 type transport system ATP-binding protein